MRHAHGRLDALPCPAVLCCAVRKTNADHPEYACFDALFAVKCFANKKPARVSSLRSESHPLRDLTL